MASLLINRLINEPAIKIVYIFYRLLLVEFKLLKRKFFSKVGEVLTREKAEKLYALMIYLLSDENV